MTFRVGLTGSIGMGKSTTARLFADAGCAVWDADAAVHRMYSKGGAAVAPIEAVLPDAVEDGAVSRDRLKELIGKDASVLKTLEEIVHPLVAKDRAEFAEVATSDILVFDIPLLFETGGNLTMDAVVCVSVSPEIQQERVLARGTMTEDQFHQIREKQMPNDEKCARSDFVVITDTLDHAREQVARIIEAIRERMTYA
ncbi:dephospho-CoA kinase [Shimia sp. CNT1-13L.2]|uniref:dephospho-CoA kinase n=1 Tax=Shimia sp. CNT1-13L.2 TaxID=2959663 RepID=UPI0020CE4989|nr:dephospho-CoA kinase [Shimia sp. CNT1-13L.2]MCP9482620.1 dephospho-CoA kinase [Shimia sp. CNT1-13L.2]